jgi:hypothetical protein
MSIVHRVLPALGWIAAIACGLGVLGIIVLTTGVAEAFGCRAGAFARLSCPDDHAGQIGELIWTSAFFFAILLPATVVPAVAIGAWLARRRRSAARGAT